MASAKKCDRCGAFYQKDDFSKNNKGLELSSFNGLAWDRLDLCPECSHFLKEWFKNPIKERESGA